MATVDIHPGTLTTIYIDPKVMTTDDFVVENFSQESRNCFAQNELKFETLPNSAFRYSYDNCIVEGVFTQIMQECGCQRAMGSLMKPMEGKEHMGRSREGWNSSNLTLDYNGLDKLDLAQAMRSADGTLNGCYGKKLSCYRRKWKNFGKIHNIKDADQLKRDCRAACNGVNYAVHGVSTAAFPSYGALVGNKDLYCLVFRKLLNICMSVHTNWEASRIVHLEDFFRFHFHSSKYYQSKLKEYLEHTVPWHSNVKIGDTSFHPTPICQTLETESYQYGTCLNDAQKHPMIVEELKNSVSVKYEKVSAVNMVTSKIELSLVSYGEQSFKPYIIKRIPEISATFLWSSSHLRRPLGGLPRFSGSFGWVCDTQATKRAQVGKGGGVNGGGREFPPPTSARRTNNVSTNFGLIYFCPLP